MAVAFLRAVSVISNSTALAEVLSHIDHNFDFEGNVEELHAQLGAMRHFIDTSLL